MLSVEKALEEAGIFMEHGSRTELTIFAFNSFVQTAKDAYQLKERGELSEDQYEKYKEYYEAYEGGYPKLKKRQLRFWANLFLKYCEKHGYQYIRTKRTY